MGAGMYAHRPTHSPLTLHLWTVSFSCAPLTHNSSLLSTPVSYLSMPLGNLFSEPPLLLPSFSHYPMSQNSLCAFSLPPPTLPLSLARSHSLSLHPCLSNEEGLRSFTREKEQNNRSTLPSSASLTHTSVYNMDVALFCCFLLCNGTMFK